MGYSGTFKQWGKPISGEMLERLKRRAWKARKRCGIVSRVRIPLSPQFNFSNN